MKKSTILSILLLISFAGNAFAMAEEPIWPVFPDVEKGQYYEDAIYHMYDLGIINGYDNGKFGPNDPLTRGQMATILDRYNKKVINDVLIQENGYLKKLVCLQFEKTDNQSADYQIAWEELCGVKAE